ncbi:unnamed protein product [Penicillium viridicatum]
MLLTQRFPSSLVYGKCYHLVNHDNEYIGHDATIWGRLKFGRRANSAVFEVCANKHICTSNQPSEVVNAGEEWLLYDTEGSPYSKGGAFLVGLKNAFLIPQYALNTNFMHFSGLNERSSYSDRAIRLHAHDSWPLIQSGLHLGWARGDYIRPQSSHEGVLIDFEEVNCPPSY